MAELRKIGVLSVMKLSFVLYFLLGLLVGLMVAISTMLFAPLSGIEGMPGGMLWGPLAVIVLPLLYGILGAAVTALGALIYNVLAARLGGVQVLILFPVQNR
jgi:hypothetical protein